LFFLGDKTVIKIFNYFLSFIKWSFKVVALSIVLFILFIVLANWGVEKKYDYIMPPSQKFEWGEARGRLCGNWEKRAGNTSIFGSPYQLLLSVDTNKISKANVTFTNIELTDLDSRKPAPIKIDELKEKIPSEDSPNKAIVVTPDLNLAYKRYAVDYDLVITADKEIIKKKMHFIFEKDYTERRINVIWEGWMGI